MKKNLSKHPIYLRLREVLNVETDRELADKLKVTPQSVNGWKRHGKIKRDKLESVASLTGVSFAWLLTGEGEKYPSKISGGLELSAASLREPFGFLRPASPLPFRSLPVTAVLANNQLQFIEGSAMNIPNQIGTENSLLLYVQDDTWASEGIQAGTTLICESPNGHDINGRIVVANCDGKPICRRFEQRGQLAEFTSLLNGPSFSFPLDRVRFEFLVLSFVH